MLPIRTVAEAHIALRNMAPADREACRDRVREIMQARAVGFHDAVAHAYAEHQARQVPAAA